MKTPFLLSSKLESVIFLACSCHSAENNKSFSFEKLIENGHHNGLTGLNTDELITWINECERRNFKRTEFGRDMFYFKDYLLCLRKNIDKFKKLPITAFDYENQ